MLNKIIFTGLGLASFLALGVTPLEALSPALSNVCVHGLGGSYSQDDGLGGQLMRADCIVTLNEEESAAFDKYARDPIGEAFARIADKKEGLPFYERQVREDMDGNILLRYHVVQ
jgi:hypothetical protein